MAKVRHPDRLGLHLRIVLHHGVAMGPGRAELLDGVREHGSISAAGRASGMSYKRAWALIEAMNSGFREPLVEAARGGPAGGGARLTLAGETVLALYRRVEAAASSASALELDQLAGLVASR